MTLTMPFGKYRGEALENVPASYLRWVLREADCVDDWTWLRPALEAELRRRERAGRGSPPPRQDYQVLPDIEPVVAAWYRELSLRFHPDRGGHPERMIALNIARERLEELLREAAG